MNDWFARILSPRPPGHSTHVVLARVEYDSASGERGDSAAVCRIVNPPNAVCARATIRLED